MVNYPSILYPRLPSCAKRLLPDYITTYEKDTTGLLKIGFPFLKIGFPLPDYIGEFTGLLKIGFLLLK
jgi:hypothetical protein